MRYFESKTPLVRLTAPGGVFVKWETYDAVTGWYKTDNEQVANALEGFIKRKVGGIIREGTQEEYEAFVGKTKGRTVFRQVREEIEPGVAANTLSSPVPPRAPASGAGVAEGEPVSSPNEPAAVPDPVVRTRGRRSTSATTK